MDYGRTVAESLLDIGAVKFSLNPPFTWSSGIKSPVYCDNRKLISFPHHRDIVVRGFVEKIKELGLNPEVIGGTATAAIPWAAFVAYEMGLPMIYIRPEKKAHGAGKQVEGVLEEGKRVLILEDLISTGGSSLNSAKAVREESSALVTDVMAIMTWGLPEAETNFARADLKQTTLTTFLELISLAQERGVLSAEDAAKVSEFRTDPHSWAERVGIA
ncbi:orotate phosphoribosyltransferase [Candidatus Peregrinibacteria bacterium CG_4_9_14_0_2_um_filter_53_11]|nr:MAG: orotate phosphoribosyltransferase [Candidatus Peregrinibacteria bacterium CG_4_9_14_0_2_um_filter_53_11]